MISDHEVQSALEPYYEDARREVEADPDLAEWREMAAAEVGTDRWLARNMIALQVEMRMPSIQRSLEIVRAARRLRFPS